MEVRKLRPQDSATMNKIMAEAKAPVGVEAKPKREFKKRPEVKINRPFSFLAGYKIRK